MTPLTPHATIIIIGGGFGGTMVAANLIRTATDPLHIYIIEKTGNLARGIAYSTPEPYHLLNIPGGNMGAYAEDSGHFMAWLSENEFLWRNYDKEFNHLPLDPNRYYPRKLYGKYLEAVFQESLLEAAQKNIHVTVIEDEAIDAEITEERTARISLKNHFVPHAQHVVIATGNTPVKSFAYAHGVFLCRERYIENMWSKLHSTLFDQKDLSYLPETTHIAIVGTGLTMVDAFLSLKNKGYRGKITAISRHGKLPHVHKSSPPYPAFMDKNHYPKSALSLFLSIRREVKNALKKGEDWRSVLQALRPETNLIWANLPAKERRYITRRLLSYWNIHRHRIPGEVMALIANDQESGTLTITAGTIYYIGGKNNGPLMVSYRRHGEDIIEYTAADYVINCSGPETDIAKSKNMFLLKLRDRGIINIGTLRAGIELTPTGRVKGKAADIFHAVGALMVGEQLESTAVPDIRAQASDVAKNILIGTKDEDYSRYSNYFI